MPLQVPFVPVEAAIGGEGPAPTVGLPLNLDILSRLVRSLSGMGLRRSHEGSVVSIVVSIDPKRSRHPRQAIRADSAGCQ